MNLVFRLAWRNLWRHPRRTWLTVGAIMFSNMLLVFMISLQFGMYGLMIDNTLQAFTGHLQIQAPGYKDDEKMRQVGATISSRWRRKNCVISSGSDGRIAARATAFALASSEDRSYGVCSIRRRACYSSLNVSNIPRPRQRQGRYLQ